MSEKSKKEIYESVLRDARLAAAAINEARDNAKKLNPHALVNELLEDSAKKSRDVVAYLMESEKRLTE